MTTLFERLGGDAAVSAAVDAFYSRVLADPLLSPLFAQVSIDRLRAHQQRFLTFAFGGDDAYGGRGMTAAHAGLVERHGLTDEHFDAVLAHLRAALLSLGVSEPLADEVHTVAGSVRNAVLGRTALPSRAIEKTRRLPAVGSADRRGAAESRIGSD